MSISTLMKVIIPLSQFLEARMYFVREKKTQVLYVTACEFEEKRPAIGKLDVFHAKKNMKVYLLHAGGKFHYSYPGGCFHFELEKQ